MKIAVVTGVWKRPRIFEMFAKGIKNLPVEVDVIVAGSEGRTSRQMVQRHGFKYIETPNSPLSAKMNATTLAAKDYDYVICMGSDDILSPELMKHYLKWMTLGYDFIGLTDFYFYDTTTRRAMYWGGYRGVRQGETVGAGRVLSSKLLKSMDWKPWGDNLSSSLDSDMNSRIKGKQIKMSLKKLGVFAVDIKSSTNITKFNRWDNTTLIDRNVILNQFSYIK